MNAYAAAHHEAGHAVAAVAAGRRVEWLSIESCGGLAGLCCSVEPHEPAISEAEFNRRQYARAHAAHRASQAEELRHVHGAFLRDREGIEPHLLILLAGPVAQRVATGQPFDWQSGASDFEAALALVGGPDGSRDFFAALQRAERLLSDRWREVTALAAALTVYGRIDAEHVADTLARVRQKQAARMAA